MIESCEDPRSWAQSEFGHAQLNDVRNVSRLMQMAATVAAHPHPIVAQVFEDPAEQQAAYDFIENPRFTAREIIEASMQATACRACSLPRVLIPLDGCCLTLPDPDGVRGMGSVGRRSAYGRGLQVLDAVALREDGLPLGLAGLLSWARPLQCHARSHKHRPLHERETIFWLDLRAQIRDTFAQHAPNTERILLHDSGADAWGVLLDVIAHDEEEGEFSVIRAAHNRRAFTDPDVPSYLWSLLERAPIKGRYRQKIPAGHGRTERRAIFDVSAQKVTLDLCLTPSKAHEEVTLWAVRVRERGRVPAGQERLEWVLFTTWPVESVSDARRVISWYVFRWRVEDFHKTWKQSGSDIEQTALEDRRSVEKWMALHAAVSARALRLTHLARQPDEAAKPATAVFSEQELEALGALRAAHERDTLEDLTVEQAVTLVAGLGGYVPQKGRHPGPKILRRGLERLEIATQALQGAKRKRSRKKQLLN
jgi:hypothetical protein